MKFKPIVEQCRVLSGELRSNPSDPYGAFRIQGPCGALLYIIASDGNVPDQSLAGWEHVSVRREGKHVPNWQEMCFIKDLFWAPEECVVQFHPPRSQYVNSHPGVLHLWKWTKGGMPLPPSILVGVMGGITTEKQARELWIEMNGAIGVKRRDYGKQVFASKQDIIERDTRGTDAPAVDTKDVSTPTTALVTGSAESS